VRLLHFVWLVLCATLSMAQVLGADETPDVAAAAEGIALEHRVPGPTWYAQALSRGPGGLNVTHFWSKGASLRAETVIAGHKIVTIVHRDTYFAYDVLLRNGLAITRAEKALALAVGERRPFGNEAEGILRQGAELVREEDILGRACDVFRVTDTRGRREVWVTKDAARLPLHMEIYHRTSGTRQSTDYLNWQTGLPVPDEFFEPEPEIVFERFGFEEYVRHTALEGPVGPVPVLYGDLLHGPRS